MIQLYWKNASSDVVTDKNGISKGDLDTLAPAIAAAHRVVQEQIHDGHLGYAKLPTRRDYRDAVMALVDRYRGNTTDLVVLGIGGSALGNIALQAALNPATYNLMGDKARPGPRLFVLDNVDPAMISDTLKVVRRRLKTTLVNVISKSGETAETASQFMIFREELKKKLGADYAQRIVATTDLAKGTLNDIATAEGYPMLAVPDDVGGRFSVLSPVGLFSAAMCGIDIDALLGGAAAMRARLEQSDWRANIGCVLAAITYLSFARKGKPMHVMMPYSNRLYLLADWYRQLWAESLGKNVDRQNARVVVGPTPIKALGTTDQHSQVQLYREGPNDKLTIFLEVEKHPANIRVPKSFGEIAGLAYLGGAAMGKLLNAEKLATEFAMAKSLRPTVTLRFPEITPASVGEFIYLFEYVTSLMGEMLNIDAYNQPAVELGKKATFALMGRGGYEDVAKEMKPFTRLDNDYLL